VGGDIDEKEGQAVVLDGQVQFGDQVFGYRQEGAALFKQNVAVVGLLAPVVLLVLFYQVEDVVDGSLHRCRLQADLNTALILLAALRFLLHLVDEPLYIFAGFLETEDRHAGLEEDLAQIVRLQDIHVVGGYLF